MRRFLVGGIAALLILGGAAAAAPALAQTDPTYPVTSFTDWTTGGQNDFQQNNNARGQYVFQAGTVNAVSRALTRWPDHYNPAYLFQHLAEFREVHPGERL